MSSGEIVMTFFSISMLIFVVVYVACISGGRSDKDVRGVKPKNERW